MESQIEKKILEVTSSVAQKEGESRQDYLKRLGMAVNDLPEDKWPKIGEPAQDWFNATVRAGNEKKELPEFPDAKEAPATTERPRIRATPIANAAAKPAAPAESTAAAAAPASTSGEAPKAETPKKTGKKGGVRRLKELMIAKPAATKDELRAALKSEEYEIGASTFDSVHYDLMQTLQVLVDLGKLPANFLPAKPAAAA